MKKILFIGTIIMIMMFSGCQDTTTDGPSVTDPFIGGTDGLIIDFIEDSPPDEVYAGGDFPFDVVVELKNEGEKEIKKENVMVTISGINAQEFSKTEAELSSNPEDDLEARRKENGDIIESNPAYVEFIGLNRLEDFSGNTYTIRADVCYLYGTDAVSKLCIRKNNLDSKEGVCEVNENKEVHNSGAPVQITDFKEVARAKDKVAFTFTIEHKGNGQIYRKESNCGMESRRENEDRVFVEVSTGLSNLECQGLREGTATTGITTLYGGDKTITCTQQVDTSSEFEKPVEIKLIYDYEENKETSVFVKSSGLN